LRNRDEKEASRLLKNHLHSALQFSAEIWERN